MLPLSHSFCASAKSCRKALAWFPIYRPSACTPQDCLLGSASAVLLVSDLLAGCPCYDLLTPAGLLQLSRLRDPKSSLYKTCSLLISAQRSTRHATSKGQQAAAKLDALLNAAATASEYNDAISLDEPQCSVSSDHLHERGAPGATALATSVRQYWGLCAVR